MPTRSKAWAEIVLPQLAESVVNATITQWLKQPGDPVEEYEAICEVMTDKVNAELPSTAAGVMKEILVAEGQTADVGAVLCLIDTGEGAEEEGTAGSADAAALVRQDGACAADGMRGHYSPAVRKLAEEHRLNLSEIPGTGLGGRVTRKDVLTYLERSRPNPRAGSSEGRVGVGEVPSPGAGNRAGTSGSMRTTAAGQAGAPSGASELNPEKIPVRSTGLHLTPAPRIPEIELEPAADGRHETFIDVTPIRNAIATRMRQSVAEIPHAWTMIEVDVTNLVLLRNKLKEDFKRREGVNLTYLAFLLKAVVSAIKDYPIMNSVWAVDKIIVKRDINISLAVGTEDSVLTPVIKQADQKNIAGLAREIEELAVKTRNGKLAPSDMSGGTFTVNNTGSFGSILSYPIINYPQAAILTFESIVKRPVVIHDMIAVRSMANLCLSLDHRILDGVICGRFLQRVKENLEAFGPETSLY